MTDPSPRRSRPGAAAETSRPIGQPANTALLDRDELLMLYQTVAPRLADNRAPILVVTSATSGAGVSTVAREFGQVVAGEIRKTVLLLVASPKVEEANSLAAVIDRDLPVDKAIEADPEIPLLYHARLCTRGGHASRLFESAELDRVLSHALQFIRLILIDAPPVLSDMTALTLARRAAGVILVVEAEKTRTSVVEQARRSIESTEGRLCGVILNKRRHRGKRPLFGRS